MDISLLFLVLFVLFLIIGGSAAWASFSAASWVPMWSKDLKRILDLAKFKKGDVLYDLGCGDGRILQYAAENYDIREAVGFEISFIPYFFAKLRAKFAKGHKKMSVKYGDLYRADLSKADVIVCFLTPKAMKKLKTKFEKELKDNARILSYAFEVPGWEPREISKTENEISVFLYHK